MSADPQKAKQAQALKVLAALKQKLVANPGNPRVKSAYEDLELALAGVDDPGGEPPIRLHPKTMQQAAPTPAADPVESSLGFSEGLLGSSFSRLGGMIARAIPVNEDPGVPGRHYSRETAYEEPPPSGGDAGAIAAPPPGDQPDTSVDRFLTEKADQAAMQHPWKSLAQRFAGGNVRNLPAALIPGGLWGMFAASPAVTAANTALDARGDVSEALRDTDPYVYGGLSAFAGGLTGGRGNLAKTNQARRIANLRAAGAGKAQAQSAMRGVGKEHLMEVADNIEAEGLLDPFPSTPRDVLARAEEAQPKRLEELRAVNREADSKATGMMAREQEQFYRKRAAEPEALASSTGERAFQQQADRWNARADAIETFIRDPAGTPLASVTKGWNQMLEERRAFDKLARKSFEGGTEAFAPEEAREIASFMRTRMLELADQVPGDLGKRLREANKRYEATQYAHDFSERGLFDAVPSDQLGRDMVRGAQGGLAAGRPDVAAGGAAVAGAATMSKTWSPDLQRRWHRYQQNRIEGFGPKALAGTRAASLAVTPSRMATSDAIMREIARQKAAQEQR